MVRASLIVIVGTASLAATPQEDFFESKVRPVLARCYGCHAENATAGLRIDSRKGLLRGGRSGPAIRPGSPSESILLHAVKGIRGRMEMPPAGTRLPDHEIAALTEWIAMGAPWPESPRDYFVSTVRPLLDAKCLGCHSTEPQGELRMDSHEALVKGGRSGPALVAGDPEASRLVQRLYASDERRMPPTGPLTQDEKDVFSRWVRDGAVWDDESSPTAGGYEISDEHRAHWSFQPLSNPSVSTAAGSTPSASVVDRFVLSELNERGLRPSPAADKRTLIRRLTFDLTGMPPTTEEVKSFLADTSEDAYSTLVERLLASRRYGERWGRHWLDLVRYADTAGDAGDFPVPEAYKYRNYVIDAFQDDKPYDTFIREQIAGDLLEAATERERWRNQVATGYLAISRRIGVNPHRLRHIMYEDMIDNLGKTFLGLSVQCARCHDHKFDPIPTSDYYALYGILDSTVYPYPGGEHLPYRSDFVYRVGEEHARRVMREYEEGIRFWNDMEREKFREYQSFQNKLITTPGRSREVVWEELQHLRAERAVYARTEPALETAYAVREGNAKDASIQRAGDPKSAGPLVRRGFLQILGGAAVPPGYQGSGRMLLADWIADPDNPLTARVMVNRIWHHHFGVGLVRTTSDFGLRGAPPSHPELLDYLARYFIDSGWSVKAMHRLIVHSRTYRQQSLDGEEGFAEDPQNEWLWRANRRRLDAEQIRDTVLFFSGELELSPGHRHPFPHRRTYFFRQHEPFSEFFPTERRSVYLMQPRIQKHPYLDLFDGPDGNLPVSERKATTTTLQALYLMNSDFVHGHSETMAERWSAKARTRDDFLVRATWTVFGRPPRENETERANEYFAHASGSEQSKRAGYLRAMLSSNEFLFID